MPKNMRPYDDYELGNARLAAQSMRPASQEDYMPDMNRVRSIASQTQDYNDYEADNARPPMVYNGPDMTDYNDYEAGNAQMAARSIADMARMGRGTDTMMAHVTPGDYVVPRAVIERDPAILSRIKKNFDEEGADYRDHMIGHEMNSINPETGQPEFFFKKISRAIFPWLGGVKPFMKDLPARIGFAVGGPGGYMAGKQLGESLYAKKEDPISSASAVPQENLDISTPNAMELPDSLSGLGGLSDIQQTSQIATQGAAGTGGVSREGQDYFVNQLRRRLTTQPTSGLLPIEGTYLNRLGVNFQPGNTRSILEGIARGGLNA
jgi:hypothetical protein